MAEKKRKRIVKPKPVKDTDKQTMDGLGVSFEDAMKQLIAPKPKS